MIVVEDLKLNKFRNVSIPSNKDIYERVGLRSVPVSDGQVANFNINSMTPDDVLEASLLKPNQMPLDTEI